MADPTLLAGDPCCRQRESESAELGDEFENEKAHENDALGDTLDGIATSVERSVEEVVRRLLERGQHEHRILHLGDSETSDTEDLSL